MASNFRIFIDKNSDCVGLKLAGDFDATSAYELIYATKRLPIDWDVAQFRAGPLGRGNWRWRPAKRF
jgi:hypothetical protein